MPIEKTMLWNFTILKFPFVDRLFQESTNSGNLVLNIDINPRIVLTAPYILTFKDVQYISFEVANLHFLLFI